MRVLLCVWNQINLSIHRERERKGVRAWDLEREKPKKKETTQTRERESISLCEICGFVFSSDGWLIKN
jgi:hypothetical protein